MGAVRTRRGRGRRVLAASLCVLAAAAVGSAAQHETRQSGVLEQFFGLQEQLRMATARKKMQSPAGTVHRYSHVLRHMGILPGTPGNHNPSFTRGPDITTIEDVGTYVHGVPWATDLCDGEGALIHDPMLLATHPYASRCPSSGVQTIEFTVVCDRPALFRTQPALSGCAQANCNCPPQQPTNDPRCGGLLTFETSPNQCGTTLCAVHLDDGGNQQCVEDIAQTSCPCPGCCNNLDCSLANGGVGACPGMQVPAPFLCPAGCEPADCSVSITQFFSITVTCVNDQPSFECRGSAATSGANAVFKGDTTVEIPDFIFNIAACADCARQNPPNNNELDRMVFTVDNDNPDLFAVQPQIVWDPNDPFTADLRYDPKECVVGTAQVTVTMCDDGGIKDGGTDCAADVCRFQIEIKDKNTPPSYDMGHCPIVVDEDHGPFVQDNWGTRFKKGCDAGNGEESQQDLVVNTQLSDPADAGLFLNQPAINPVNGQLTFTANPNANTFGKNVEIYVQLCDNGVLKTNPPPANPLCTCDPITNCPKCQIVIRPKNDLPSFTPGEDVLVSEDLCQLAVPPVPLTHVIPQWAKDINVGAPAEGLVSPNPMVFNPEGQRVHFVVTTDNDGLFAAGGGPVIDETGTLSFTLRPNANGISNVRATLWDTGTPPGEGPTVGFKITALPVNDKPTFDLDMKGAPGPLLVPEGAGPLEFDSWLSRVSKGPDDEVNQELSLRTWVQRPECFKIQPTHDFTATTAVRLSFEPVASTPAGQQCCSDVTVFVKDTGLDLRCNMMPGGCDCGDESEVTYPICVTDTNDPPSFTKGPDVALREDQFPNGYTDVNWATQISAGPNEGPPLPQTVLFHVVTNNDALFRAGKLPTIDPTTGTLQFQTAPDACGDALVSVYVEDSGVPPLRSPAQQFTVTVACCNDAPEFTLGPDLIGAAVPECRQASACPRQFPNFATSIRPGPISAVDEAGQTVRFFLDSFDASLFEGTAGQPKITEFGTLTFTPKVGVNTAAPFAVRVCARDDGVLQAGCASEACMTFQLQITPYNDAPSFVHTGNVEVLEDSGARTLPAWARSITAGPVDEQGQTLTFRVTAANPALFAVQPTVNAGTGTLSFTPAPDAYGTTELSVVLDDGQAVNSQFTQTIMLTIVAVNDRPSFTAVQTIDVLEDRPSSTDQFATAVSKGAANEGSQTLRYDVTGLTNPSLFSTPPAVDADGILTYTLASNKWGESTFVVTARDDGGTAHMGQDTSLPHTVTLKVASVNDPPTFRVGADITGVLEDSGPQARTMWIRDVTPGSPDEAAQEVTFVLTPDKPELFVDGPSVDQHGTLTFTPAANAFGMATVQIVASDTGPGVGDGRGGGPPDKRSSDFVFTTITIVPVNDAPRFVPGPPPVVEEDATSFPFTDWAKQVTVGADNEASTQDLTWRIVPRDHTLFNQQPTMAQQGMSMCDGSCTADLQFSVAKDQNGVTTANICLSDNGGTTNGGVDTTCLETVITITPVDDPPLVTVDTAEIILLEDSPKKVYDNWLRNVVPGPRDEMNQQITSVSIQAAVGQQAQLQRILAETPQLERWPSGPLSVTPVADMFGKVELYVVAVDSGVPGKNTAKFPFSVTVLPVNDAPSFTGGGDVTNVESTGTFSQRWATNIVAGPPNESDQTLRFDVQVGDQALFSLQPSIDPTSGVLTFEPSVDKFGKTTATVVLHDSGGKENGGVDASMTVSFVITVFPKNNRPFWYKGADVSVLEDSGSYSKQFATNISAGGRSEVGQQLTFVVTATPENITVNTPVIDATGVLTFVPNLNRYGVISVRAVLTDNGGVLNGGASHSAEQAFNIIVVPVNDPPVFAPGPDVVVLEDAPRQTVRDWLRAWSPGTYETDQSVAFSVTANRPELFSEQPGVSSITNALTFTPSRDTNGEVTVTVFAKDNGGVANGGDDESDPHVFRLTIHPVNDAPVFNMGVGVFVTEDDGPVTVGSWAGGIAPGPPVALDEASQTLTFAVLNNNPTLFKVAPAVSPTGDLTFQLEPNANGVAEVSVTLKDSGGVANGGVDTSATGTFVITVGAVDDPPTFTPGTSVVNLEPHQTYSQVWATGISGGPADEDQQVRFSVTNDNPGLFTTQPAVSPAGILSFVTAPSAIGSAAVSVVAYDIKNNPSAVYTTQIVVNTQATAVRAIIKTNDSPDTFNRKAYSDEVCRLLGVPSDRCVTTLVVDDAQGLQVQVEFQPRFPNRLHEPTAVELARRFLLLSTTPQGAKLGVVRAWPVPAIGVSSAPLGCSAITTRAACVAPCVWDPTLNVCTDGLMKREEANGWFDWWELLLILLACALVISAMAATAWYLLTKRKGEQEERRRLNKQQGSSEDSQLDSPYGANMKYAGAPDSAVQNAPTNPLTEVYPVSPPALGPSYG